MQLLLREQELYKDLIMVLVGENMNEGKSFHYFAQIERMMKEGVIPEYAFVGKCDTDTFINLRGLVGELDKLPTEQQHFVGLDSFTLGADRRIMFGMLYIMSRPLLQRVAQLQLGVEELKLAEDLLMGALVVRLGEDVKWVSLQLFNFECFRHPLTRQDIATHWCKKPEDMWQNQMLLEQLYAPSS
ncbi:hypothetical protein BDR26DRAFT_866031 [Obelidium mucronatum]|nr:hypothetical protein BDR26DRAFT_866031 [Obelidium mucronatum]